MTGRRSQPHDLGREGRDPTISLTRMRTRKNGTGGPRTAQRTREVMAVRFSSNGYDLTCAGRSDAHKARGMSWLRWLAAEVVALGSESNGYDPHKVERRSGGLISEGRSWPWIFDPTAMTSMRWGGPCDVDRGGGLVHKIN